jgi:hypothetical protein
VRAVLLFFLIFLSSSCFNQVDCLITASGYTKIDFYQKANKQPKVITFSSIMVSGGGAILHQDSIFSTSTLLLPVSPTGDTTRFTLGYDGKSDFITVKYSTETRIISPDCGAFTYFKDLEILNTSFDQGLIKLINTQLLKDAVHQTYVTNVQVFF